MGRCVRKNRLTRGARRKRVDLFEMVCGKLAPWLICCEQNVRMFDIDDRIIGI